MAFEFWRFKDQFNRTEWHLGSESSGPFGGHKSLLCVCED